MTVSEILSAALAKAESNLADWDTTGQENRDRIERVSRDTRNRACVRLVLACMLAKAHNAAVDPRRPYTEISEPGAFSGRSYDEGHISALVQAHRLPVNSTTAFLTPALRNVDYTLTPDKAVIGRPRELYADALHLLQEVAEGNETADAVLADTLRVLLKLRNERDAKLAELQASLRQPGVSVPLSSEGIVKLLQQHLACQHSSRLPVLIVAAAYQAVGGLLGERAKALTSHNAADVQTGAAGDVEISLTSDEQVRTVYEMKQKPVTVWDINRAIEKLEKLPGINNYLFVTTERIDDAVREYAEGVYPRTGGIEFAILDCLGFVRHFLHFFHRHRAAFLDAYQALVLAEPDSAVSFALKQAFLALRQAAIPEADSEPPEG
jgi:DNA adenine methylase